LAGQVRQLSDMDVDMESEADLLNDGPHVSASQRRNLCRLVSGQARWANTLVGTCVIFALLGAAIACGLGGYGQYLTYPSQVRVIVAYTFWNIVAFGITGGVAVGAIVWRVRRRTDVSFGRELHRLAGGDGDILVAAWPDVVRSVTSGWTGRWNRDNLNRTMLSVEVDAWRPRTGTPMYSPDWRSTLGAIRAADVFDDVISDSTSLLADKLRMCLLWGAIVVMGFVSLSFAGFQATARGQDVGNCTFGYIKNSTTNSTTPTFVPSNAFLTFHFSDVCAWYMMILASIFIVFPIGALIGWALHVWLRPRFTKQLLRKVFVLTGGDQLLLTAMWKGCANRVAPLGSSRGLRLTSLLSPFVRDSARQFPRERAWLQASEGTEHDEVDAWLDCLGKQIDFRRSLDPIFTVALDHSSRVLSRARLPLLMSGHYDQFFNELAFAVRSTPRPSLAYTQSRIASWWADCGGLVGNVGDWMLFFLPLQYSEMAQLARHLQLNWSDPMLNSTDLELVCRDWLLEVACPHSDAANINPALHADALARRGRAFLFSTLGQKAENIENAIKSLESAFELYEAMPTLRGASFVHGLLGDAYRMRVRGDTTFNTKKAVYFYNRMRDHAKRFGWTDVQQDGKAVAKIGWAIENQVDSQYAENLGYTDASKWYDDVIAHFQSSTSDNHWVHGAISCMNTCT